MREPGCRPAVGAGVDVLVSVLGVRLRTGNGRPAVRLRELRPDGGVAVHEPWHLHVWRRRGARNNRRWVRLRQRLHWGLLREAQHLLHHGDSVRPVAHRHRLALALALSVGAAFAVGNTKRSTDTLDSDDERHVRLHDRRQSEWL